jgi:hypothetical protein
MARPGFPDAPSGTSPSLKTALRRFRPFGGKPGSAGTPPIPIDPPEGRAESAPHAYHLPSDPARLFRLTVDIIKEAFGRAGSPGRGGKPFENDMGEPSVSRR